ncbi:MAG TPA: M50 family metallopeptidase [Anaerolineae bacterium]|nr:M50 family metallopeptidase [Anaerolineae bacterium]
MLIAGFYAQNDSNFPLLLAAAIVAASIISLVPALSYPFRLLFTIIHELGHGLMAWLTGGRLVKFELSANGSGMAYTVGGTGCLILPAGYLGTALFSAGLILLGGLTNIAPYVLGALGGFLILFVSFYGWASPMALLSGSVLGLGFIGVAGWTSEEWSVFLLNFLAIFGGLTALGDLRLLTLVARFRVPIKNDAADMAHRIGCPALFWATLWFLMSLVILGAAIWLTWFSEWW